MDGSCGASCITWLAGWLAGCLPACPSGWSFFPFDSEGGKVNSRHFILPSSLAKPSLTSFTSHLSHLIPSILPQTPTTPHHTTPHSPLSMKHSRIPISTRTHRTATTMSATTAQRTAKPSPPPLPYEVLNVRRSPSWFRQQAWAKKKVVEGEKERLTLQPKQQSRAMEEQRARGLRKGKALQWSVEFEEERVRYVHRGRLTLCRVFLLGAD